ncbi:amidohydrolase family protein [Dyadobacter chenwenxiniae]|uniref:Amidohydrolase family protein n=1 Tax=Dyadobacter chenwenxiniae TaxID=2906456 RepID=A0A9X1PLU0_9BACT|nr:amidohydrolase family protein [Dyadobacter chenwenxiniae]MCF0063742.1 amidohydrolase family protein [Dyadobacter chenwenxiniae]UON83417.1 amidohydrolase family protein [Dyadobacter chenwenxiniae]
MTKWFSFILAFLIVSHVNGQTSPKKAMLIRAGFVYNSEKNLFEKNQEILIVDGKIADIGPKVSAAAGTKIIDMSKHTVTPGLVDAHTHLLLSIPNSVGPDPMVVDPLVNSGTERILRGAAIAKTYLNAGFTTVRDLGNSGMFLDVTLKNAIERGYVEGPRMFVSGPILSAVGGQFEKLPHHLSDLPAKEYRIIKGVDDARQAVMEHLNAGVDVIKICSDNSPNTFLLTIEEMKAIVETAHQYGKKVTAHATFDKSIQNAILAGVDGIEHGYGISDSSLTLMAQRNVYWVPTSVSFQEGMIRVKRRSGITGKDAEAIVNSFVAPNKSAIQSAIKKGIKVIAGSDNYIDSGQPTGDQAKDVLVALRETGASVADVIRFATYNSSQILNRQGTIGTLKKGAQADISVFDGNLEQDFVKSLFQVRLVLKGGDIVFRTENE